MSREVHLFFTGIIALDPVGVGPMRYWVLIPEGGEWHHAPHYPTILVDKSNRIEWVNGVSPPPVERVVDGVREGIRDDQFEVWRLDGYQIEVETPGGGSRIVKTSSIDEFLLDLEDGCHPATPGGGRINSNFYTKPERARVAATMELRRGWLETSWIHPHSWKFDRPGAPEKYLAQEVCMKFETDEDHLELSFLTFDGKKSMRLLIYPPGGGAAEVRFANTVWNDILPYPHDDRRDRDEHVRMYYEYSAVPVPNPPGLVKGTSPFRGVSPNETHRHQINRHLPTVDELKMRRPAGENCPPGGGGSGGG